MKIVPHHHDTSFSFSLVNRSQDIFCKHPGLVNFRRMTLLDQVIGIFYADDLKYTRPTGTMSVQWLGILEQRSGEGRVSHP
jgi:hypothetical protein